jgi:hypothetical protein
MFLIIDDKKKTIHRWMPDFKGSATLTNEIKVENFNLLDREMLQILCIGTTPTMKLFIAKDKKVVGKNRRKIWLSR